MPQAAAMAVDAVTALAGLDTTLSLKNGESLLIFGASGGIGHLAVQFAKRMGARVLAVASGDDGVAFVRGLGADKVVDGYKEDVLAAARQFALNGLDAVLLTTGGEAAEKSLGFRRDGLHPGWSPVDISCGASGDVRLFRTANFAWPAGNHYTASGVLAGPVTIGLCHPLRPTVQHIDRVQPERANGETVSI